MKGIKTSFMLAVLFSITACSSLPEIDLADDGSDRRGGGGLLENRGVEVVPLEGTAGFEAVDLTERQLQDQLAEEVIAQMEPIVYFDFDQYTVAENSLSVLRYYADVMIDDPNLTVKLEGHTDERGSPSYNLALGERRAQAVLEVMKAYGVAENRLLAISFGEEKPKILGQSEESYAMNRRVELNFR